MKDFRGLLCTCKGELLGMVSGLNLFKLFGDEIETASESCVLHMISVNMTNACILAYMQDVKLNWREDEKDKSSMYEPEPEQPEEPEPEEEQVEEKQEVEETQDELQIKEEEEVPPPHDGANEEVNPRATELEESNALALAILQPGSAPQSTSNALSEIGKTSCWELVLVTTPSNTKSNTTQNYNLMWWLRQAITR